MHARETAKCKYVSKRKWRKEHAFNLYLREGICVLVYFQVILLYANLIHVSTCES